MFKWVKKFFKKKENETQTEEVEQEARFGSMVHIWTDPDGEIYLDVELGDVEVKTLRDFAKMLNLFTPVLRVEALESFRESVVDTFGKAVGDSIIDLVAIEILLQEELDKENLERSDDSGNPLITPTQIFSERQSRWA